jgi:hypothetical protein
MMKGKEEQEESEEKEAKRGEWKEKNESNLRESMDALALQAVLEDNTKEYSAKSCYTKVHLDAWKEMCGGATFMEIGMLFYRKDDQAPEWLTSKKDVMRREYPLTEEQEESFLRLLNEELEKGIVKQVPHTYPPFLIPVFIVPKKGGEVVEGSELQAVRIAVKMASHRTQGDADRREE